MDSLAIFLSEYSYERSKQWLVEHEPVLLRCVVAYVIGIFAIKFVMRTQKPFGLQTSLTIWNSILAVFSIAGFVRMTPTMLKVITEKGLPYTYTNISELQTDRVAGYWAFVWTVSKIPELVDTFFIVLRKKPLMFMHWYHHALTGYFAFVTFYEENAYMIWVVWLNYFIHSWMYSYYCARAMNYKVPPQFAQLLTGAQIVQFVITHAFMGHLLVLMCSTKDPYAVTFRGYAIGAFMEMTYLALWFRFYYISYIGGGGKKYLAHKDSTKIEKNGIAQNAK